MEFNYFLKALRRWNDFRRRARRAEYWWFVLFNAIVSGVVGAVFPALGTLYGIAVFLPVVAVTVRRLHDVGKDWPWMFISLIPVAGPIWLLVILAREGDHGPNQFGPNPMLEELDSEN